MTNIKQMSSPKETVMTQQRVCKVIGRAVGMILLAGGLQLYGQQPRSGAEAAADAGTFIEFNVPAATCDAFPDSFFCTEPNGLNLEGAITGTYTDAIGAFHGFVRGPGGKITTFDGPGAVCPAVDSDCAVPTAINLEGTITGFYCTDWYTGVCPGFLRAPGGAITTFNAPNEVYGTYPNSINLLGVITGSWLDVNYVSHGFVRAPDGTITSFDAPNDVNGTTASGINPLGVITGSWLDVNYVSHGFVRAHDGTITSFDAPNDVNGTTASSINPEGAITGSYQDANYVTHGYLRASDGAITEFDPPGSTGTYPSSINPLGVIAGSYYDVNSIEHGFLRTSEGSFTTLYPPGDVNGSYAMGINPAGAITGAYYDVNFASHGYLWIP